MKRIESLDTCRGWLILLVVFGHAVGAAGQMTTGSDAQVFAQIYKWIYLFHMPAFFFLSGLLFREEGELLPRIGRLARRLLVPYLIFGFLFLALYWCVGVACAPKTAYYASKFSAGIGWSLLAELFYGGTLWKGGEPFVYNSVLWFLPVLFAVEVLYASVHSFFRRTDTLVRSFLLILLILLSWPIRTLPFSLPLGLNRAIYYLIYFSLGHLLSAPLLHLIEGGRPRRVPAALVALILFAIFTLAAQAVPDLYLQFVTFRWHLLFILIATLGIVASLSLAVALDCRVLRLCGVASLAIMLLHKPLVVALQFACPPVRTLCVNGFVTGLVACLLISALATGACLLAQKLIIRFCPWALGQSVTRKIW